MEREWNLAEVSDGKVYSSSDMAKVGCNDCKGCSACCRNMGQSIVLDPYDVYQLAVGQNQSFQELLATSVELNVVEGLILPNLKMQETSKSCYYLNEQGRCRIHSIRPGMCRMFPLGRVYENDTFQYFLQIHECKAEQKTKVKIRQWLGVSDLKRYENFISDWHYFLKKYQNQAMKGMYDEGALKQLNMRILNVFYLTPYDRNSDFYEEYETRKCSFR
ncbi:MAG: YkgJ family cysteine cluster protein [Lachnospiraceae bacterium]|nr:YkgJ family cysteine cluster protein [Lachnospiraceae bacterium]